MHDAENRLPIMLPFRVFIVDPTGSVQVLSRANEANTMLADDLGVLVRD